MSERLPSQQDWTVIVGSGIAGLMAALTLAPQPVLLLTRGVLGGNLQRLGTGRYCRKSRPER